MSGADCYHWEVKRKQRVIERQRESARNAALLPREKQTPADDEQVKETNCHRN